MSLDIKKYIASGKLELYALGLLSELEMLEVDELLTKNKDLQKELDEIMNSIQQTNAAVGMQPSSKSLEQIKSKIKNTNSGGAKVISLSKPRFYSLVAASVSLIALSLLASMVMFNAWQNSNNALTAMQEESQSLQTEFTQMNSRLDLLRDPMCMKLKLKGLDLAPDAYAVLHWNTAKNEVYIDIMNLPETEKTFTYQLWAINDGKPIDAGTFEPGDDLKMLQQMKSIQAAQAFAVTLEPAGGSVNPTMDKMYLYTEI